MWSHLCKSIVPYWCALSCESPVLVVNKTKCDIVQVFEGKKMENLISSPLRKRIRSPGLRAALSAGLPAETRWWMMDDLNKHWGMYYWVHLRWIIGFTRDDRVDPHWGVASQSEAKTHVAFAHPHCSVETSRSLNQPKIAQCINTVSNIWWLRQVMLPNSFYL